MEENRKIVKLSLLADVFGNEHLQPLPEFLGISTEENQIDEGLNKSRYRDAFRSEKIFNTRYVDVEKKIRSYQPDILHVACPVEKGNLLFAYKGKLKELAANDFIQILNNAGKNIRLLVLRAYETEAYAKRIAKETGIVVLYMKKKDGPERSAEFLEAFYQLLGNGMTISQSFELAKLVSASRAFELCQPKRGAKHQGFIENPSSLTFANVFASNPTTMEETPLYGIAVELDTIKAAAPGLEIQLSYPSGKRELVMRLAYNRPELVHFASHAGPDMVVFYAPDGSRVELEKFWLIHLMEQLQSVFRCVFLNSCHNEEIAYRLSQHIDHVIGTTVSIDDMEAVSFAYDFYDDLGKQSGPMDYKAAFNEAVSMLGFRDKGNYKHFTPAEYEGVRAMNYEDHMLATEEAFLNRYGDINDQNMHTFRDRFERWYQQFGAYPGMEKMLENHLKNFTYYSETYVNHLLPRLFIYLKNALKDRDPQLEKTVFCPLLSQENRMNSSFEYWVKFYTLNKIDRNSCKADLKRYKSQLQGVENVVYVDDFLGSGETFCDHLRVRYEDHAGRHVYYLVIHAMKEGIRNIEKKAKALGLEVHVIYMTASPKAFQLYKVNKKHKNSFIDSCEKLGVRPDRVLGYGKSEALCGFYNNIPNNNLGIFYDHNKDEISGEDRFLPLFDRKVATSKAFQRVPFEKVQDYILNEYQKNDGGLSFQKIQQAFRLSEEDLADIIDQMLECGSLAITEDLEFRPANDRKIVVYEGAFHPPTLAHQQLLLQAVKELGADFGMFVPSGKASLSREMFLRKEVLPPFSEDLRARMLEVYTENEPSLLVNRCELGEKGATSSYHSLEKIQRNNPNARLYYLMEAEGLWKAGKIAQIEEFLKKDSFFLVVMSREEDEAEALVHADPVLSRYEDKFLYLKAGDGDLPDTISAMVRKKLLFGEDLGGLVPAKIEDLIRENLALIPCFSGKYSCLSSSFQAPLFYEDVRYESADEAFRAQKEKHQGDDWDKVKLDVMLKIQIAKFTSLPLLRMVLMATKSRLLINGNKNHETYWGVDLLSGKGENHLGEILMKIRG